jgi:uncharacterized membrane protein
MDVLIRPARLARSGEVVRMPMQLGPIAPVALAACAAAIWVAIQLIRRGDALATRAYDQAFFQQLVWNLDHGRWFVSSFNQGSFLGLHFSPILVVPAALELFWPDPRMLDLVDAVAIGLTAPAAFLLLRAAFTPSRAGGFLAAGLAAALPVSPIMQEAARAGFHPETLALPAALVAGWAGLTRRPLLMWIAAAVPLLAKEDQVYTVAVIGILVAVRGRSAMRRHGVFLFGAALVWAAALFLVIMPLLRAGAVSDTDSYYRWLGPFPTQVLAPFRDSSGVWNQLTIREGWMAAAGLVVCVGGLPLLRPKWALLILPPLVANLLSRHYPQPELHLQYGLLLVVSTVVAAGMGGRRALAWAEQSTPLAWRRFAPALLAAAAPALVLGAVVGSLPPAGHAPAAFGRQPGWNQLMAATQVIPPDAPVAADDNVAAPLASRSTIYVLPHLCASCYVVVDSAPTQWPFMSAPQRAALLAGLPTHRHLLADDGRFQVWSPAHD